jgi:DNA-directed RNA polymerase subunit RPC12/RpoP
MFCPSCGAHIQFAGQNLDRKIPCPLCRVAITLRAPGNLKMSCSFCHEHIEFPSHALGQRISCPHCKEDITLKESA